MAEYAANTPILVGVAAVQQKVDDYQQALEPIALMEQALRDAAQDAGSADLLRRADEILLGRQAEAPRFTLVLHVASFSVDSVELRAEEGEEF